MKLDDNDEYVRVERAQKAWRGQMALYDRAWSFRISLPYQLHSTSPIVVRASEHRRPEMNILAAGGYAENRNGSPKSKGK